MQVGGAAEDHVVQPPAHSRVNFKVKSGYSGLYPVESPKPTEIETAQASWAACFTLAVLIVKKLFTMRLDTPISTRTHCLIFLLWTTVKRLTFFLTPSPEVIGDCYQDPQTCLSSRLNSASSPGPVLQHTEHVCVSTRDSKK